MWSHFIYTISLFSAKIFILFAFILFLLIGILAVLSKGKEKLSGKILIKKINDKFDENIETFNEIILSKTELKRFHKEQKKIQKEKNKNPKTNKNIFVLKFDGDVKASAVENLREEITAILGVATTTDEVVILVESGGGMVHAYGLAATQLARLRKNNIPLTVIIDKVAASGGYLMSAVANKIIAAPFAIIGSIGVIVQLPNFHRLLKENHIDFEQLTAGSYKRTLTVFGENTKEGRQKLKTEIEEIHHLFKNAILEYRPQINIDTVATGEHWLGQQALHLNLVDALSTSDDYLFENAKNANVYDVQLQTKKSFLSKLSGAAAKIIDRVHTQQSRI